ncbi:MAG TPA: hypothetical protein GXX40_08715 [Firmicutes bacterium]|nr:hypothetical protein [Bacillota bacterium]
MRIPSNRPVVVALSLIALLACLILSFWLGKTVITGRTQKCVLLSVLESNTHGLNAVPIAEQVYSPLDSLDPAAPVLSLPPAKKADHAKLIVIHDIDFSGFRVEDRVIPVSKNNTLVDLAQPIRWGESAGRSIADQSCRLETPELLIERFDSAGNVTVRVAERRITLRPGEWFAEATIKSQRLVRLVVGEADWESQLEGAMLRGETVSRLTILNHGMVQIR